MHYIYTVHLMYNIFQQCKTMDTVICVFTTLCTPIIALFFIIHCPYYKSPQSITVLRSSLWRYNSFLFVFRNSLFETLKILQELQQQSWKWKVMNTSLSCADIVAWALSKQAGLLTQNEYRWKWLVSLKLQTNQWLVTIWWRPADDALDHGGRTLLLDSACQGQT